MRRRRVVYLDSSALVKLVFAEPETAVLERAIADARRAASELSLAEVLRGVGRMAQHLPPSERAELMTSARDIVTRHDLIALTRSLLTEAGELGPPRLRTLDAIHLVSARTLGDDLDTFLSYDRRQLAAALGAGLPVLSPGVEGRPPRSGAT